MALYKFVYFNPWLGERTLIQPFNGTIDEARAKFEESVVRANAAFAALGLDDEDSRTNPARVISIEEVVENGEDSSESAARSTV